MKVRECSKYDDKTLPPLWAMREIAWTLSTDKKGEKIGFLSPLDRKGRKDLAPDRPVVNPLTGDREYD